MKFVITLDRECPYRLGLGSGLGLATGSVRNHPRSGIQIHVLGIVLFILIMSLSSMVSKVARVETYQVRIMGKGA